jgi:hypothetical protein
LGERRALRVSRAIVASTTLETCSRDLDWQVGHRRYPNR